MVSDQSWRRTYYLDAGTALTISFAITLDNPDPQDKHHYEQRPRTRRTELEIKKTFTEHCL